jgi:hypothetical protein
MQTNTGSDQPNHQATLIADSDLALAREIHRSMLPRDYISPQLDIADQGAVTRQKTFFNHD